jgi:hypothetical protein
MNVFDLRAGEVITRLMANPLLPVDRFGFDEAGRFQGDVNAAAVDADFSYLLEGEVLTVVDEKADAFVQFTVDYLTAEAIRLGLVA